MINSCEGNKRAPKGEKNKRMWKVAFLTPRNANLMLCLESDIGIVQVATKITLTIYRTDNGLT